MLIGYLEIAKEIGNRKGGCWPGWAECGLL